MAKQHGNPAGTKPPLSRHPLFPAIVALWFGALFGLGSLAIRTSLLEALIISSRIEALLPVIAPPLGMKARILLALSLAVIGGITGAALARRLARPKPERRERKRQASTVRRPSPVSRLSDPITPPSFVSQDARAGIEEEAQVPAAEPTVLAGRRRSLAVEQNYAPEYARDDAPLPGGAPQIFDVTAYDFEATPQQVEPAMSRVDDLTLDLAAFAEPADLSDRVATWGPDAPQNPTPAVNQSEGWHDRIEAEADIAAAHSSYKPTPYDMTPPDYTAAVPQPSSQALNLEVARPFAAPAQAPVHEAVPAEPLPRFTLPTAENSLFEAAPQSENEAEEIRQVFATPLSIAAREQSIPETSPSPFAPPDATRPFDAAPQPIEAITARMPQFGAPEAALQPITPAEHAAPAHFHADPIATTLPAEEAETAPANAAARISGEELGSLSPVELIERLARSLERRRNAAAHGNASLSAAPVAIPVPGHLEPIAAAVGEASSFAIPQEFEPAHAPIQPEFRAPANLDLPASMRPVLPDQYEAEDDLPDFTLPRQVATPSPLEPAASTEPEEEAENDALEEGYSSLLDIARPNELRQQFVRIEEPEPDGDAIEPVVIFPGQAARNNSRFSAAMPAAADFSGQVQAEAGNELRRFDAPDAVPQLSTPFSRPSVKDPEETERALRSALATLQRMSGAA